MCKVDRGYKGDKRPIPAIRVGFTEKIKKIFSSPEAGKGKVN